MLQLNFGHITNHRIHRRDAEDAEVTQRIVEVVLSKGSIVQYNAALTPFTKPPLSLRTLCVLCVSAVKR